MNTQQAVDSFSNALRRFGISGTPEFHIVLGSGFGAALDRWEKDHPWAVKGELSFEQVPTLATSTVPDHHGTYRFLQNRSTGKSVVVQMGRLHGYEGHTARQVVQTVMIPRLAGIKNFILTNAAGGLDPEYRAGDAMIIRDHVNLTGQNPLVGANPSSGSGEPIGPRFPDLSELYDMKIGQALKLSLENTGIAVHSGIYLGLLGPSFETPSEVALFSRWGLQAVGMSTVWEAIALRHSGARIAGMSLISNPGAGLGDGAPLDHLQILETCRNSAERIVRGVFDWLDQELGSS